MGLKKNFLVKDKTSYSYEVKCQRLSKQHNSPFRGKVKIEKAISTPMWLVIQKNEPINLSFNNNQFKIKPFRSKKAPDRIRKVKKI